MLKSEQMKSTMMENLNYNISVAQHVNYTRQGSFHPTTLWDVLGWIRNQKNWILHCGNQQTTLGEVTDYIRSQHDPNVQNQLKKDWMPVVMFNGVFKSATAEGYELESYSNITALDFDNIESQEQSDDVKRDLLNRPYVVAVFHTFKPYRLKAIVGHDNINPELHKDMYKSLMSEFDMSLLDTKCSDITRRNYLVYDPDIWVRQDFNSFKPYHFEPLQQAQRGFADAEVKNGVGNGTVKKLNGRTTSPDMILYIMTRSWHNKHPEYWMIGQRSNSMFSCATQLCKYGVPQSLTEDRFITNWIDEANDMSTDEIRKVVDSAYKSNADMFGTLTFTI